jgi:hypothetical protein
MSDDVVAPLAPHAEKEGLIPKRAVDLEAWTEIVQRPNSLHEEHWLLSHEAVSRGWLGTTATTTTARGRGESVER